MCCYCERLLHAACCFCLFCFEAPSPSFTFTLFTMFSQITHNRISRSGSVIRHFQPTTFLFFPCMCFIKWCFSHRPDSPSTHSTAFPSLCKNCPDTRLYRHSSPPPTTHTHLRRGPSKLFQVLFAHSPENGWKMEELAPNRPFAKSPKTPKWSPLKFLGSWQSEATVFGGHF